VIRSPGVICVVLAFLCVCALPTPSLGQGSGRERPPSELWQKFPFEPHRSRTNEGGATRARPTPGKPDHARSAAAAQPSRRSAGKPVKRSGHGTAIPVAVVLPLGLLFVGAAVAVPIAIRSRRGHAKREWTLRAAAGGSLGKAKLMLRTANARSLGKAKLMLGSLAAGSRGKARSKVRAAALGRVGRTRSQTSADHRANKPSPPRRPVDAPTSAPATPAPAASPPPPTPAPAARESAASDSPGGKPAPASVPWPAVPPPPGRAADRPAPRADRAAGEKLRPGRSGDRGEGAFRPPRADETPAGPADATGQAVGYARLAKGQTVNSPELRAQAQAIEQACAARALSLLRLVWDVANDTGADLERPGLQHALERIAAGEASCLVVAGLDRLSRSAADLGTLVGWLEKKGSRLIAVDLDLDTATQEGRLAARALAAVGGSTRGETSELTPSELTAAHTQKRSGRPAVADRPALEERIRAMREGGMTLQAIADKLNAEGVPTLRGGARWRPSSVQAATGYKRPRRKPRPKHPGPDR
jgi:DNA invertase Pin-like site-specific DNA recombinase